MNSNILNVYDNINHFRCDYIGKFVFGYERCQMFSYKYFIITVENNKVMIARCECHSVDLIENLSIGSKEISKEKYRKLACLI